MSFINSNKTYKVYSYTNNEQAKNGFFVLLTDGKQISLLLKEKIKLYDEVKAQSGYDKYQPPKFKREKDKFFVGFKNNSTIKLPKKKKDILNLFSLYKDKIESFTKDRRLGFKNKQDLIDIFNFYNTLLKD